MESKCQCLVLRGALQRYLSAQVGNVEALVVSRDYLQSESGQLELLVRRLRSYISASLNLGDELVTEIIAFQTQHMSLWLAGVAELKAAAASNKRETTSPNWFAYDEAFTSFLAVYMSDSQEIRKTISEVNTAKTQIWIAIQEPSLDPAFLLLAAGHLDVELKRLVWAVHAIENFVNLHDIDESLIASDKTYWRFKGTEKNKFLEDLSGLEQKLGARDEYLKSRTNLGLQIRHVYAHGNGYLDVKAIERLTYPFESALKPGMKIPFGIPKQDFGTDFFIDVFAALISTVYLDVVNLVNHELDCDTFDGKELGQEMPELRTALPKTFKACTENRG